jgi:two-component system nitrogen regulation sensor histidine kinase GlnL
MVLASLLEAVLVFDQHDRTVFVNQAAEALLGRSRRILWGLPYAEVFADAPWLVELIDRLDDTAGASLRMEGALDSHGQVVLAEVSTLRDRNGQSCGTVATLHDLARRQALAEHERSRSRVNDLDRLVAQLGHEINNPLAGIRGAAQRLGRRLADSPEMADYAQMIVRQADRMAALVEALMLLEAPRPTLAPLNVHQVLNEVVLLEEAAARSEGVSIIRQFDPSLPDVLGDRDQLEQVFMNLLKNAVAACSRSDRNGRITLVTRVEHGFRLSHGPRGAQYMAVEVRDNGPGLDDETRERMFSPLYSRSDGGHGMGLAIAQSVITAHGGLLRADNLPEGGAKLVVLLPIGTNEDIERSSRHGDG